MRRSDLQLSDSDCVALLTQGEYGILSTLGHHGYPYGVPVNYVYVNGSIYFHGALGVGSKIESISRNPKVCFTVTSDVQVLPDQFSTQYKSAIAFGDASEVFGVEKEQILMEFVQKYSNDFKERGQAVIKGACSKTAVFKITVAHQTGKAHP